MDYFLVIGTWGTSYSCAATVTNGWLYTEATVKFYVTVFLGLHADMS